MALEKQDLKDGALFLLLGLSVWMLNRAVDRMDSILIAFNKFIDFIMK